MSHNDNTRIELSLTVEQAEAVKLSLDVLSRLGIGQLEQVEELVRMDFIPPSGKASDERGETDANTNEAISDMMAGVKNLLGYPRNGSNGIGHPHVDIRAHRAYETYKVLSRALWDLRGLNNHGVDRDGLLVRYTQDPVPVVRISGVKSESEKNFKKDE